MNYIPDTVVSLITEHLSLFEILHFRLTCKFFYKASGDVQYFRNDVNESVNNLMCTSLLFPNLQTLILHNISNYVFRVSDFFKHKNISTLSLQKIIILDETNNSDFMYPTSLPTMKYLRISNLNSKVGLLKALIIPMVNLKEMSSISCPQFDNDLLNELMKKRSLEVIEINDTLCISTIHLNSSKFNTLHTVNFSKCGQLNWLSLYRKILFCNVSYTSISTTNMLEIFAHCPLLQIFTADECSELSGDIIISCMTLCSVSFYMCTSLHKLCLQCPSLKALNVHKCCKLTYLSLQSNCIQSLDLRHLYSVSHLHLQSPALAHLDIQGCVALYNPLLEVTRLITDIFGSKTSEHVVNNDIMKSFYGLSGVDPVESKSMCFCLCVRNLLSWSNCTSIERAGREESLGEDRELLSSQISHSHSRSCINHIDGVYLFGCVQSSDTALSLCCPNLTSKEVVFHLNVDGTDGTKDATNVDNKAKNAPSKGRKPRSSTL